jgi:hypothetical protein
MQKSTSMEAVAAGEPGNYQVATIAQPAPQYQPLRTSGSYALGATLGAAAGSGPSGSRKKEKAKGGGENEKDLTKGLARVMKKVYNFRDKMLSMCDAEHLGDMCGEPLTVETLEDAVRETDVEVVEMLCEKGLNVNEPLNDKGSTVLDVLAAEYLEMLESTDRERARGVGPKVLTEMFIDHSNSYHGVMEILKKNGARMSGERGRQPPWIE